MTTEEFTDLLERRQLVSASIARQLRAKAAQGDSRITPKSILKYLVKKEVLTRSQAKELLETTLVVSDKAESSILGLSPIAEDVDRNDDRPARKEPPPLEVLEDAPVLASPSRITRQQPLDEEDLFGPAPVASNDDIGVVEVDPRVAESLASDAPAPGSKLRVEKKAVKKPSDKKPKQTLKRAESQWDSPLLLLGGGGLVVLILASVVLWWLLFRENADAVLKKANENYERGTYQQAIEHYENFLEKFSSHEAASDVRVRLRMAEVWDAVEGRKDFAAAAKMAPDVLTDIEDEPAFISNAADPDAVSEAKKEVSTLLARIAQGLAKQAEEATDDAVARERIGQIQTVLELSSNAKYVPPRLRLDSDLNRVRSTLDRVRTRESREVDLAAALKKMDEAIAAGQPAEALAVRGDLLKVHPVLGEDKALAAKVIDISSAEKAAIKFVAAGESPASAPPASPVVAELALAERRGQPANPAPAGPAVVRVDGALYGLSAADGSLLWRRFVGPGATATPLLLAEGSVIATDSHAHAVVRLDAATGKVAWRLPIDDQLSSAVLAGDQILTAGESGKLYVIEAASGKLVGHVQFSQPLRVPPAVNDTGDRAYVVGDHSSLYALSTKDFSCVGVYYLGHAAGGVATAPLAMLNKVVVADNSGAETCRLRVLAVDDQGAPESEVAGHRLSGLVITPLLRTGRRIAATTTQGQAIVFEAGAANDKTALTPIASREAQDVEPMARFGLMHEGHLWIGARQLAKLEILATGNQLPVRSLEHDYQGDAFDYPLQAVEQVIVHVRRPAGRAGAIVGAMDAKENRALWETEVAVPLAGTPAVDPSGGRMTAGTASGAVFLLEREAMTRRVQDRAVRTSPASGTAPTFTAALDLGNGRLLMGAMDAPALVHFRPGEPRESMKSVELPGPLACPPVLWDDAFVAATDVGQVFLFDRDTAQRIAAPFQPELTPGRKYAWLQPAVVGIGDSASLVVSDGAEKIYLIQRRAQPQPHLVAAVTADVGASKLLSPLAASGDRVYAATEDGKLAAYALPDLAAGEPIALGSRAAWGPFAVTGGVLIGAEKSDLIFVGADGAIAWQRPVEHGELAGTPLIVGAEAFLLHAAGGVSRINLADGKEIAYAELGQSAVAGPVSYGDRLIIAASDGALLVVNRP